MEKAFRKPAVVTALALMCCALWGSAFPCVKIGYEMLHITDTGSQILFAGYRFFLAGVLNFVIACILEKRLITMKRSSVAPILVFGLFQTTLQYLCFYIGLANTTGVKGSVINASNAFFSIIAAHFLIRSERITVRKAVGCIVGFAGVIVINLSSGGWGEGFKLSGEGMIIICTAIYGVCSVVVKFLSKRESSMTITSYQLLFGGAVLTLTGFLAGGKVTGFTWKSGLLLFYMCIISSAAFSLWTALLKYNPVGRITIFGFSIPVFGVLLSGIFLGEEIFTLKNLAALLLVGAGIVIVNRIPAASGEAAADTA